MSSVLALLLGVVLPLTIAVPSRADELPSPTELWRAYPLGTPEPVSGGTARDRGPEPMGGDTAADSRLTLQLGMLLGTLYVAFLCVWFSTARDVHAAVAANRLRHSLRVRATPRAGVRPASANSPWTCEIVWHPGHMRARFQAVIAPPGGGARRVVARSKGIPWPPKDVRKPPTQELETALGTLVAAIVAAGWEPLRQMARGQNADSSGQTSAGCPAVQRVPHVCVQGDSQRFAAEGLAEISSGGRSEVGMPGRRSRPGSRPEGLRVLFSRPVGGGRGRGL